MDLTVQDNCQSTLFSYYCENHQLRTFSQIYNLRCRHEFCDIVINVGSKKIPAHRIVLAGCSPYFRHVFSANFREGHQSEITLKTMDESAVQLVIDFCYTSRIEINERNVVPLLSTSDYFQLEDIKNVCCEFLKRKLDIDNCLHAYLIADTYVCYDLSRVAVKYISDHFEVIVTSDEFKLLTVEQLRCIISSNNLNVQSEELILDSVWKWINVDSLNRKNHIYELLECIKLPLLGPNILISKVAANKWIKLDGRCRGLVDKAVDHLQNELPTVKTPRSRVQHTPTHNLVVVGGYNINTAMSSVEYLHPDTGYWKLMSSLSQPRWGVGVAVFDSKLYAVGGHNGKDTLNSIEMYQPTSNRWINNGAVMTSGRVSIGVVCFCGHIYAIGGQNSHKYLKYVEKYNPNINVWQRTVSMRSSRVGLAVAALENSIYAVGGYDGQSALNTGERYDPRENKWFPIAEMLSQRKHFKCVVLSNIMYAVGGSDNEKSLSSVEMYDPRNNSWYSVPKMAYERTGVSVATVDNEIYAIGGNNSEINLKNIEIFNVKRNEWRLYFGSLNHHRFGSDAISMSSIY